MLTQLQLEGPELEPLLARVRNELGAAARIVHAEKIRSGGVAGFFAHQRFELTVEVDTSAPRVAAPVRTPAAPVPAAVPAAPAAAAPAAPGPAPAAPATPGVPAAAPVPPVHVDLALDRALDLDAAARSSSAEPFAAIAGLQPGTGPDETGLFSTLAAMSATAAAPTPPRAPATAAASVYAPQSAAALLTGGELDVPTAAKAEPVTQVLRPDVLPASAGPRSGAPTTSSTGFAPHAAFAAVVDGTAARPPAADPAASLLDLADRVSADEQSAVVSTESPSFASLMSRLGDGLGLEPEPTGPDAAAHSPAAQQGPTRVVDLETPGAVPAQRPAPAVPAATDTAAPAAPAEVAVPVAAAAPAELAVPNTAHVSTADALAAAGQAEEAAALELTRLGLPTHLLPAGGYGEQLHTALRASLTRLPTAPPALNRAGGVLAVVGPLSLAVHVAREIAHELGLPVATSVALATSGPATADVPERQVLRATPEAAERRTAWRRRSNLTVVAVDAPLTATGAAEARAFLAALSPTSTWGVVEATRKAQDVGTWTRALGGVHALALTDLEETADPAAVLELGIPVSRLGARPATPRAWATLLTGRLAA